MKKLVLFAVTALTISLVACGNKNTTEKNAESEPVVNQVETEVQATGDSVVNTVDSLANQVEAAVK